MEPTRILAADLLFADIITPIEGNNKLKNLYYEHDMQQEGKYELKTEKDFRDFSNALAGYSVPASPGGSSANVLVSIKKLLQDKVEVDFFGVTGKDRDGFAIQESLREVGINLLPESLPEGTDPQTATSFVLTNGNKRSIASWPANSGEILHPELITEEMVSKSNVLLVQGSLDKRFPIKDKDGRNIADRMIDFRWNGGKGHEGQELWLTVPTQYIRSYAERARYRIPTANVVLGNEEEMMFLYDVTTSKEAALALKADFEKGELQKAKEKTGWRGSMRQVGMITRGDKGAYLVLPGHDIVEIPPVNVAPREIVNTLGAGDSSYAGFGAALIALNPQTVEEYKNAVRAGMALGGAKLVEPKVGPRVENPRQALRRWEPNVAGQMLPPETQAEKAANGRAQNESVFRLG